MNRPELIRTGVCTTALLVVGRIAPNPAEDRDAGKSLRAEKTAFGQPDPRFSLFMRHVAARHDRLGDITVTPSFFGS
jgi:hypothetical protein